MPSSTGTAPRAAPPRRAWCSAKCSHGGFVDVGKEHFDKYFQEAPKLITEMPMKPDVVIWRASLGGCRLPKDVKMVEIVLSEMNDTCSGQWWPSPPVQSLCCSGEIRRWNGAEDARGTMRSEGIEKVPGCSSIEMDGSIYEFISETAEVFYDIEEE